MAAAYPRRRRSGGYSRRENPFSPLCFRTGHETFALIRLLATRAFCHTGTLLWTIARPQSLTPALLELDSVRSSVRLRVCHKTQTPPAPVSSRVAAPRQPILRLSLKPLLLGVSSSVKASGLVAFSCPAPRRDLSPLVRSAREHLTGYSVPNVCPPPSTPSVHVIQS